MSTENQRPPTRRTTLMVLAGAAPALGAFFEAAAGEGRRPPIEEVNAEPTQTHVLASTATNVASVPLGVSVSAFAMGAIGDGLADDTSAIQAAINSLPSTGGTVYLTGRHKISQLTITTPNVTLSGPGELLEGSINIGTDGGGPPYARLDTRVENLRFIRSALSPGANAITAARALGIMVYDCYFRNYNSAFYVRPQSFTGKDTVHCSRVQLSRIMTTGCNFVLRIPPFTSGGGTLVAADVLLSNCQELSVLDSHVYVEGVDGIIVSNNIMFHTGFNRPSTIKRYNVYVDGGSHVNIANNFLFEAGNEGVLISRTQSFSVTNNKVAYPGQRVRADGIRVVDGDSAGQQYGEGSISGNVIFFPSRHGISVGGPSGHISLDGNVVRSPGVSTRFYGAGSITQADYISTANTTSDIQVSGGEYSGGTLNPRIAVRGARSKGNAGGQETVFVMGTSSPAQQIGWSNDQFGTAFFFSNRKLSSGAQNDNMSWTFNLEPGVYAFDLFHYKNTNVGTYTVIINGVTVGKVDGYGATPAPAKNVISGISVGIGGKTTVALIMASKNASSSQFYGSVSGVGLTRTGNHT